MKRNHYTARLAVLIALLMALLLSTGSARAEEYCGEVVRILEGDIIEVMHKDKPERIRLAGVDCPEWGQPFEKEAKEFTSFLTFGKLVTVREVKRDRWDNVSAEIILLDGSSLNLELVRAGYAWWARHTAPEDRTLEALEDKARAEKRGLWAGKRPIAPWEWKNR